MTLAWGLIGCGKQGARYLEPRNNGGRMVIPMHRHDRVIKGIDCCIIATPPATHAEFALDCLALGIGVLLEKPIMPTRAETMSVLDAFDRPGASPLIVASPHLYARKFLELSYSQEATVVWAGPERTDGSCSAYLDWSPHAWSMAQALGTERVITGAHPSKLCSVTSNGKEYHGQWSDQESPMLAMIETMERLMHGGFDWRSGKAFTRAVYSKLFANQPVSTCAQALASVNKTPT